MKKMKRIVPAALTLLVTAGAVSLSAGAASAAPAGVGTPAHGLCPDGVYSTCGFPGTYDVLGTGGRPLEVQSRPSVGYGIGEVSANASFTVNCQVNDGSDDPADGRFETTWDMVRATLDDGTTVTGWVYDDYVDTSPQDAYGWSLTQPCLSEHANAKRTTHAGHSAR